MARDASEIKEKMIRTLKTRGPSLTVHLAKEAEMNMLFASAFLSELTSEKKIKISNMRVGSSPIYFIPGQESMLEKFSEFLKSKEKEAYLLLKERKIMKDSEQDPAIRVALRSIRDFAIPFKENDEIYWRYFIVDPSEIEISRKKTEPAQKPIEQAKEIENSQKIETQKTDIKKPTKKVKKSSSSGKSNDKFLNKVKEFLAEKNANILEIISTSKSELVLKIRIDSLEKILVAYNKKRIVEKDIVNAHKKSQGFNLPFLEMKLQKS